MTFGYEPDRPILHDVTSRSGPGETVAIVGADRRRQEHAGRPGAALLRSVERPRHHRRHDVRDLQLKSLRSQVAVVLQEPFLFPMSIAENIAYGRPEASRAEIEAAARAANAHEFITRLPEGYDTVRRRARRDAVGRRAAAARRSRARCSRTRRS